MLLYHIAIVVDIDKATQELEVDIVPVRVKKNGKRFAFIKNPNGLPIEMHE